MAEFKIYKVNTLPNSLENDSVYLVKEATDEVQLYVTSKTGEKRHIPTSTEIKQWIATAGTSKAIHIVDDINARDGLSPSNGDSAYVVDASGDSTVTSGGAYYIYSTSTGQWIKTAEAESMDMVLNWNDIQGKPSSNPAKIDEAVRNSHTHTNKDVLDKLGESSGNLTYNGNIIKTSIDWSKEEW